MATVATIEKACTVTSKGQTTLPLAIRQVLGVPDGGKIIIRAQGRDVSIVPVEGEEHRDPAIGAFLSIIAADIQNGRNVHTMPEDLVAAMRQVLDDIDIDIDEPIDGDVCL